MSAPSTTPPLAPSVLVAVVTFRRPADLAELLPLLEAQAADAQSAIDILVVDNDPAGSGRAVCETANLRRLRYVVEAQPGIAAARSRALCEAHAHDVLIFIDDDERPHEGWLRSLLDAYGQGGVTGVVGPVVSSFATPLSPFVRAGGFFDRRRLPTGSVVTVAATNNLLLDLAHVRAAGVEFDDRFGLAGGSDTLFVRQLVDAGGRFVWCDEAVVTDVVPTDRCTRNWVLRRRLRIGNAWSLTSLAMVHSPAARLRLRTVLLLQGIVRVAGGGVRIALGGFAGDIRHRALGARAVARGAGLVLGAVGYTYVEYKR